MKQKDLILLLVAVTILLTAGYIMYLNLAPKSTADDGVKVDIVGTFESQMDPNGLSQMTDTNQNRDFSSPIDYSGLNNSAPFGK